MNTNESLLPIVLGHAACTGGSLIYRVLLSTFKLRGLNEIGVAPVINPNMYNPWDPEFQLLAQKAITASEFSNILFERIDACNHRVAQQRQRLLLREHTHSFYFNPISAEVVPEGGSWWMDCYRQQRGIELKGLVSVRNPIDSWLGFRRNFPTQLPQNFDAYCTLYNEYLDKIDQQNQESPRFHMFRYEDFIKEPQVVVDKIASHIGEQDTQADFSTVGKRLGSGNSGRLSNELKQRARRPFSMSFLQQTIKSEAYSRLCERLGYEKLETEVNFSTKVKASYFSLVRAVTSPVRRLDAPARKVKDMAEGISNIQ